MPSENAGELEIGPTGSDPTLGSGTVNNYEWVKAQIDYYSSMLFESCADICWGPDATARVTIDGYDDGDGSIDFHFTDGGQWYNPSATYPYNFVRDPRDTRTDWSVP